MLEATSQHGKEVFCGSRRAKVSEEREGSQVLQNYKRILCAFKVECLY